MHLHRMFILLEYYKKTIQNEQLKKKRLKKYPSPYTRVLVLAAIGPVEVLPVDA